MNLIFLGVVAGVIGTFVMDTLNNLFSQTKLISKIDIKMIGRMSAGWIQGRFCYRHPDEMKPVDNELLYGYITHYMIGIGLSVPFVLFWSHFIGGPVSPLGALAYGISTTIASYFIVYPSMGLGVFGRKSPQGIKSAVSSLANHLFYGLGLAFVMVFA
jgi:hypothetical protein